MTWVVKKVSLRFLLVVPFVVQVFAAVGLTGYLSLYNGKKAVDDLATRLCIEVSGRIHQHLDSYMKVPQTLSHTYADVFDLGILASQDLEKSQQFFAKQIRLYNVGYILFGSTVGELIAAGRSPYNNRINIDEISQKRHKNSGIYTYEIDKKGNRTKLIEYVKNYSFQKEAWYAQTAKLQKPLWSTIYQWETKPYPLSISATHPVFDKNKNLIGVVAVEQRLSQISNFLRFLKVSPTGKTFILERNGLLVANSSTEQPFTIINEKPQRLKGENSSDYLIQATAKYLIQHFGDISKIKNTQQLDLNLNQQRQFVLVTPWQDDLGLDWLVVVVVPEADFMEQIYANTRTTILLCFGALILAVVIGIYTSRRIIIPIQHLTEAATAMSDGCLEQKVENSRVHEIRLLTKAFNRMAVQLRSAFTDLEKTNQELENANSELENRVEKRTEELTQALRNLKLAQAKLVQNEKMSSLGQLVAGIAHEINNPISFIYGNLVHARQYLQTLLITFSLYQKHYPQPIREIQEHLEEADISFIEEDFPKLLNSIKVGTERINNIILSLRIFSRLDEAELKTVDIHTGLDSTLLLLQHRFINNTFLKSEIKVIKIYGQLPKIECYSGQMNQVFFSIINNAIDALERGLGDNFSTPQIQITTEVAQDNLVLFRIRDNGCGIPEEALSKIFDPFFTTKPVGKGTGLGLSICYQVIVEKHKGQLSCVSTLGEGTEFAIAIPIQQSSS
jgi:signal transduction histidine kinase